MYKVFFNERKLILTDNFTKHFQVNYGLFYKYRDLEFSELKAPNEEIRKAYSRCHWWADNWKADYWIVLTGNQGTGKGMVKIVF